MDKMKINYDDVINDVCSYCHIIPYIISNTNSYSKLTLLIHKYVSASCDSSSQSSRPEIINEVLLSKWGKKNDALCYDLFATELIYLHGNKIQIKINEWKGVYINKVNLIANNISILLIIYSILSITNFGLNRLLHSRYIDLIVLLLLFISVYVFSVILKRNIDSYIQYKSILQRVKIFIKYRVWFKLNN